MVQEKLVFDEHFLIDYIIWNDPFERQVIYLFREGRIHSCNLKDILQLTVIEITAVSLIGEYMGMQYFSIY